MTEVTDMALELDRLRVPDGAPLLELVAADSDVVDFVGREHPAFHRYYAQPVTGTTVFGAYLDGELVGSVLIEEPDGAIACVVTAAGMRDRGIGSAIVIAACQELGRRGHRRVTAGWVSSITMYGRLGFEVWRSRVVPD